MAIQEITSPPMLDSTGQSMVTKLQSIANAINSNAGAISYDNTISGMTATKVQSAIDEVKGITDTINASLTQYTTYATTADEIVIGKKDGKTLYRKYVSISNLTVATNTEFIIANSVLPNNASNVSISDKSRVRASAIDTSMSANSMYWIVYAVGQSIRGRQGYSASATWDIDVWVEYTKG